METSFQVFASGGVKQVKQMTIRLPRTPLKHDSFDAEAPGDAAAFRLLGVEPQQTSPYGGGGGGDDVGALDGGGLDGLVVSTPSPSKEGYVSRSEPAPPVPAGASASSPRDPSENFLYNFI